MNRNSRRLQAGFTLVEALVVLAIIALIAVISMTAFDGSRSKAQTLIAVMGQSAQGAQQFRTDTGTYPKVLAALTDGTLATAANTFSGKDVTGQWSRPYIAKQKLNGNNFVVDKVGAGVELTIVQATGGIGKIYYILANNVPADIVTEALRECNSSNGAPVAISATNLDDNKCVGVPTSGTFGLVFDQTR